MKRIAAIGMLVAVSHMDAALAVGPGYLGDLSGQVASIGNSFGPASAGLPFNDLYSFDLSDPAQAVGTTVTVNLELGGASFELSDLVIQLADSTGVTVYDTDSQLLSGVTLSVNALLLNGTGYRFLVNGDVTGSLGGAYGGVLEAAPVPEGDVWSMLLAGTGLVALRMRSRNRAVREIRT